MDKNLTDDQQYDERLRKRTRTELSQINVEIREFIRTFYVHESFSARAYVIARAEYQYERLFSKSSELGEFGKYVKTQYPHARSMINSIVAECPSVWEKVKKGDQYCLSNRALLFGKDHKWEDAVAENTVKALWITPAKASAIKKFKAQIATKLGEMINGEEERVPTIAEENWNSAEKQRASEEKRREEAESKCKSAENRRTEAEEARAKAENIRIKAEETRMAEFKRIYTEAQDATTKALSAAEEAHSVANAIHGSVSERPKQQGTLETPSGREKDPPRWKNLPEDPESEKNSIIEFHEALGKAGWQFTLRDIVRFHTSVRCEPLTILGGAPGSGKSSLARMYASYFGFGETERFLTVDVQPSWHDRMDFLGFVKTHGDKPVFVDAETGVAQFLRDADASPKGLWLACLEEINLARPEHYFSDFLQRISLDDFTRAKTPIEFKGLSGEEADKGSFTLVPSVRFVGTCNFDETTQNFSARFLDRCNYIEFQPPSILSAFFPSNGKSPKLLEFDSDNKSIWTWHPQETLSRERMDTEQNKNNVMTLIKNCEESLKTLGVLPSPRVVSSMIRYIEARIDSVEDELADEHDCANTEQDSNAKKGQTGDDNKGATPELTTVFQRAFDEAFAQRILSKLSTSRGCYPSTGTKTTLEELRGNLKHNNVPLSLCSKMIEQYIRQFNTMMNV